MNKEILQENEDVINIVSSISIEEIIPNTIDKLFVNIIDGHHTIFMPINFKGMEFRNWKKGRGGIYSKDVLNHSLGKKTGNYLILKGNKINCIIRLIEDDELLLFESLKLIDGKIKDKPYMILKHLKDDEALSGSHEYVNENEHIILEHLSEIEDEVLIEDKESGSISLFEE